MNEYLVGSKKRCKWCWCWNVLFWAQNLSSSSSNLVVVVVVLYIQRKFFIEQLGIINLFAIIFPFLYLCAIISGTTLLLYSSLDR